MHMLLWIIRDRKDAAGLTPVDISFKLELSVTNDSNIFMKRFLSKTSLYAVLISSALAVSSCGVVDNRLGGNAEPVSANSSENLLAAQGSWNIVEEDQNYDPVALHKKAKNKQDPARRKKTAMVPSSRVQPGEAEQVHFRLLRVEREVAGLRQDFNKLLPPLSNLIMADSQLGQTIQDIQAGKPQMDKPSMAAKPQMDKPSMAAKPAAMMKPDADKSIAQKVVQSAAGANVTSVRFGQHPGKTRVVLDVSADSPFSINVDNSEKLLIVELPSTGWGTTASRMINNPMLGSYKAQPSANGGTILAFELKKPVRVTSQSALRPNATRGHRIFFDVAPG